jgi:hypothetical protein
MKIIFAASYCCSLAMIAFGSSSEEPKTLSGLKGEVEISIRDYLGKRHRSIVPEFKLHCLRGDENSERDSGESEEEFELRKKENTLHDFKTEIGLFRVAKSSDRARLRMLPKVELKTLLRLAKRHNSMRFAMEPIDVDGHAEWHVVALEVFQSYWELPLNRLASFGDNDEILNFQYLLALYF